MNAVAQPRPRSLVWATDIDVLPADRTVERHDDHLVVRSPSNPSHWWGNFLLFDDPPGAGDGVRWGETFAAELPGMDHRAFGWDRLDGDIGEARAELANRGFELSRTVGLIAEPAALRPHPRANREVTVRALDPAGDVALWEAVVDVQVAGREPGRVEPSRAFLRTRLCELRELFAAGRGAWYLAITDDGELTGSCGIVVTAGRGRFQQVDTAEAHRRLGICSRLVVEAAHHAAGHFGARQLVIAADAGCHALGLYESLGFRPRETVGQAERPAGGSG